MLKQIGFVDGNGVPSPAWKQYRGSDHKAVLGRAIKVGYADLYNTYPDAHARSNTDISHVFSTKSDAGKQAIDKMVSTFKNLVALAEFTDEAGTDFAEATAATTIAGTAPGTGNGAAVVAVQTPGGNGLAVNINIALTLPETSDEKVFAAFFKAMREHLLTTPDA